MAILLSTFLKTVRNISNLESFSAVSTQPGRPTNQHSSLNDVGRVEYLHSYIAAVLDSVRWCSNARFGN
ncbi:hypothetical protein YC2023_100704 [Brassica napus]